MKKKVISLVMAIVMCLGLAMPVMASDRSVTITSPDGTASLTLHGVMREQYIWLFPHDHVNGGFGQPELVKLLQVRRSTVLLETYPDFENYMSFSAPAGRSFYVGGTRVHSAGNSVWYGGTFAHYERFTMQSNNTLTSTFRRFDRAELPDLYNRFGLFTFSALIPNADSSAATRVFFNLTDFVVGEAPHVPTDSPPPHSRPTVAPTPPQAAPTTNLAFPVFPTNLTIGFGHRSDGINFDELFGFGNGIYFGTYNHVTQLGDEFRTNQHSSYSQYVITREGVHRPILWRIVGDPDSRGYINIISEYIIDSRPFHNNRNTGSSDYSVSHIRDWLNGSFLNSFSQSESEMIMPVEIVSYFANNSVDDANAGRFNNQRRVSTDRVYLPIGTAYDTLFLGPLGNSEFAGILRNDPVSLRNWRTGIPNSVSGGRIHYHRRASASFNHISNSHGGFFADSYFGVRPMMNIDPTSIIFISEVVSTPQAGQALADGENFRIARAPQSLSAWGLDQNTQLSSFSFRTRNFRLTILNPNIVLQSLARDGITLTNGAGLHIEPGGSMILTTAASGYEILAYKIVRADASGRHIVAYGTGTRDSLTVSARDFNGNNLLANGDYALYVWAQRDNGIYSREGSEPMYFRLNVGDGAFTPVRENPSAWAVDQVSQAIAAGLVPQNLQSAYTRPTTRAEFTALAVALYETATGREITGRTEFSDTNDVNVQKMAYLGVVQGVGGGNFAPNNQLTREQAAVMLARLANVIGQPLPVSAPTFADNANIASWAVEAVGQMQASGIMGGVGNNNFAPGGDYTREQSIVTILRLFDILD